MVPAGDWSGEPHVTYSWVAVGAALTIVTRSLSWTMCFNIISSVIFIAAVSHYGTTCDCYYGNYKCHKCPLVLNTLQISSDATTLLSRKVETQKHFSSNCIDMLIEVYQNLSVLSSYIEVWNDIKLRKIQLPYDFYTCEASARPWKYRPAPCWLKLTTESIRLRNLNVWCMTNSKGELKH